MSFEIYRFVNSESFFAPPSDWRLRLWRIDDAVNKPIESYLTALNWFERWEVLLVKRHVLGKYVPVQREEDGEWNLFGPFGDRYLNQLDKLDSLSEKVLIAGCQLGASPVEMSCLLMECRDSVWRLAKWFYVAETSRDEHVCWDALDEHLQAFHDTQRPLKGLLVWKKARAGHTGPDPQSNFILSHGNSIYSISNHDPVEVSQQEDVVFQGFLKHPAMSMATMRAVIGYEASEVVRCLRKLSSKYGGIFAPAIRRPQSKGAGGYSVRIRRLHPLYPP